MLVLQTSLELIGQVELQHLPLAQVHGAALAVVGVVVLHLHVAALIDGGWVGEHLVHRRPQPRRVQDPVYEDGVGVGDDYAVSVFLRRYEFEQVCHSGCEGDGLQHAADPVEADILLS